MKLKDAFSILIKVPGWYKSSGIIKEIASRDKKRFNEEKLSIEKMRFYLSADGWKCVQIESWEKDINNDNKE